MSSHDNDDDVSESVLGTKEYWAVAYEKEIENFESNEDAGEIWFGRSCQDRIIKWLRSRSDINPETCRILDLGCGNGAMTLALRNVGYKNVVGVDYAPFAISLAKLVAEKQRSVDVQFQVCDILSIPSTSNADLISNFDILLDKGTYDAIGLMENGIHAMQQYKKNVSRFFSSASTHRFLIIASCNSTKDELLEFFKPEFAFRDEIAAPNRIVFGGRTGSTVTTVVLQLVCESA